MPSDQVCVSLLARRADKLDNTLTGGSHLVYGQFGQISQEWQTGPKDYHTTDYSWHTLSQHRPLSASFWHQLRPGVAEARFNFVSINWPPWSSLKYFKLDINEVCDDKLQQIQPQWSHSNSSGQELGLSSKEWFMLASGDPLISLSPDLNLQAHYQLQFPGPERFRKQIIMRSQQ